MYKMEYYSVAKTVWKFAKSLGVFGSGAAATAMFPDEAASVEQWAAFLALCLPPLLTALRNFWKHKDKIGGKVAYLMPFLFVSVSLSGCLGPSALMGKTTYDVTFSDVTNDQATNYQMRIKAPPGVDLASVTGMTYDWNGKGAGTISVSQDQTTNTTVQAATIVETNAQSLAAISSAIPGLLGLATAGIDAKIRGGEIKADVANRALEKLPELKLRGVDPPP